MSSERCEYEEDKDDFTALVPMLEYIVSEIESAIHNNPQQLNDKLSDAIASTSKIIEAAIPNESDRGKWMNDLSLIDHHNPNDRTDSCSCPQFDAKYSAFETKLPTPSHVRCIHSCDAIFCSAQCRRSKTREHAKECKALRRRKLLKSIGLSSSGEVDDEMF